MSDKSDDDPFAYLFRPGTHGTGRTADAAADSTQAWDEPLTAYAGPGSVRDMQDGQSTVGRRAGGYDSGQPVIVGSAAGLGAAAAWPAEARQEDADPALPDGRDDRRVRGTVLVGIVIVLAVVVGAVSAVMLRNGAGTAGAGDPDRLGGGNASTGLAGGGPATADRTVEAEDQQLIGGAVRSVEPTGHTGSGFVTGLDRSGAAIVWRVRVASAGQYTLTARYSNGQAAQRYLDLSANGRPNGRLRMPSTGVWKAWGTTWYTVDLKEGDNEIRLSCGSDADSCQVNVDRLMLSGG